MYLDKLKQPLKIYGTISQFMVFGIFVYRRYAVFSYVYKRKYIRVTYKAI